MEEGEDRTDRDDARIAEVVDETYELFMDLDATAEQIDTEVRKLVDDAYARAKNILLEHRNKLEVIAKALLEFETLDGVQIREVIEHGRLINPPPGPPPNSGSKLAPEKPPKQVVIAPDVTPPLSGGLSGAPA